MAEQRISRGLFHRVRGGGVDGKRRNPPPQTYWRVLKKRLPRRGGPNRCTHGSDRGAGHRGRGGCAKRRCGRIGAHPIVAARWNRLSAWPSVACILLHSHSRTAFRVLEYRQQRASASAPPHEAAHCGNRALVSPTTPVRSSQPKGTEEARWLHPRYASDTKPLCRSCARPARESEPFCAAERTRCRIERLACAPFGRPSNRSKRCTHP